MWYVYDWRSQGTSLPVDFRYASNTNAQWLDLEGIKKYIAPFEKAYTDGN
jgi:hypothetical protein